MISLLKILISIDLVDCIIGKLIYKVYHHDIPVLFENDHIENHNIHIYAIKEINHMYIAHIYPNRCNMAVRFQGGKVWNCIVIDTIPYNDSVHAVKREYRYTAQNI